MLARNPLCCLFSMSHFLVRTLLDQSPSLHLLILSCYQNLHLILIVTFFAMNPKTPMHVFNHFKLLKSLKRSFFYPPIPFPLASDSSTTLLQKVVYTLPLPMVLPRLALVNRFFFLVVHAIDLPYPPFSFSRLKTLPGSSLRNRGSRTSSVERDDLQPTHSVRPSRFWSSR